MQGSLSVQTGLKVQSGGSTATALAGERNTVQTIVELAEAQNYDTARTRLVDDSRHPSARHVIFLLGRSTPDMDTLATDIYRCQEIVQRYRNEPDQEIKDYSRGQSDRAERLIKDLQLLLKRSLSHGSFIFRGHTTAVDSLDSDVLEAGKKYLAGVAQQVFERYAEASVRAETALAEKFLRVGNLTAVPSAIDPLGLVQVSGGLPNIHTAHKALVSMRDYIMEEAQHQRVQEAAQELTQVPEWGELTPEEHTGVLADLETLTLSTTPDLQGLQTLLNQEPVVRDRVHELKSRMVRQGQERRQQLEDEKARAKQEGRTKLSRDVAIPNSITDASQLDVLIQTLQTLRHELALYSEIEVRIHIQD
jgi:hypothetical protein